MKSFLDHLQPDNTFICFTHCDHEAAKPDKNFIAKKIKALKKYTKLEIPLENVILFDKTKESLKDFVSKMVRGTITVAEDIEERVVEFDQEMP